MGTIPGSARTGSTVASCIEDGKVISTPDIPDADKVPPVVDAVLAERRTSPGRPEGEGGCVTRIAGVVVDLVRPQIDAQVVRTVWSDRFLAV